MRPYETVRLLVDKDGEVWCRTLNAAWLVGGGTSDGSVILGFEADDRARWGRIRWTVLQGAKGKIVVYSRDDVESPTGRIQVFDSFTDLQGQIPDNILRKAEIAAGIRQPHRYPEEPLDV